MKKLLLAAILMFSVGVVQAELNSSGLSKQQQAEIQLTIENMKNTGVPVAEQVEEWVGVSERVSKIFTTTINTMAKDASMTVNEFVKTDVGKMAVGIVIYKVAGERIIGIIGGVIWFLVMLPLWFYFFKRLVMLVEIRHFEKGEGPDGATSVTKYITLPDLENYGGIPVIFLVLLVAIIAAGFVMIF